MKELRKSFTGSLTRALVLLILAGIITSGLVLNDASALGEGDQVPSAAGVSAGGAREADLAGVGGGDGAAPAVIASAKDVEPKVPSATSEKAREVAMGVQKVYENTSDLVADFEQIYTYKITGVARKSSGKVFFKMPGMMRWDYQQPEPRYFVSDGKELFVYEPKAGQAMRSDMTDSALADSVAFLFGQGDILGSFNVVLDAPDKGGNHKLILTPLNDEGHYRRVVLEVDAKSSHVVASVVEDPAGNLNKIVFRNLKVNVGLPKDGFKNPIPKGVKIVDSSNLN